MEGLLLYFSYKVNRNTSRVFTNTEEYLINLVFLQDIFTLLKEGESVKVIVQILRHHSFEQ